MTNRPATFVRVSASDGAWGWGEVFSNFPQVGAGRDRINLASLREALGEEAVLMTDANQAWSPDEAPGQIAGLAPFRPHWIEEPIMADQPVGVWKTLANDSAVPLAAGENLRGLP